MLEHLSEYIILNGFQSSLMLCVIYIYLRHLFRKSILLWSDPLNIALFFGSFSLVGFLVLPFVLNVGSSYWIILILVSIYFFAASKPKISVSKKEKRLNITPKIQILFSLTLLFLMIMIVMNDLRTGNIPILRENGLDTRFEGTDNRYLFMLFFSISGMPLIFFSLSEVKLVKDISFWTIVLVTMKNILMSSKSAIFFAPFLMLNYHFLLSFKIKNVSIESSAEIDNHIVSKKKGKEKTNHNRLSSLILYVKSKKNKVVLMIGVLFSVSLAVLPIYINMISSSSKNAFYIIFARLFTGYDSFIFVSESDIPMRAHMLDYGMPIWMVYFQPLFKFLFNFKPQFNSVPELIMYKVFGVDQELLKTSPIPNSNIILESVWTSGIFFGTLFIITFALISFSARKMLLEKSNFLLIDVIFFSFFVMEPLGWFTTGSIYFSQIVCSLTIYLPFTLLLNLASSKLLKDNQFQIL